MIVSLTFTFAHYFWCYLFTNYWSFGVQGVGLAFSIADFCIFTSLQVLTPLFHSDVKEAWFLPDYSALHGLYEYVKLGIPSILMLCLEYWSFELMTLFAGYISVNATAAHTIALNLAFLLFMFPLGFNYAATALIGKSIGN
jgi:MATE family multidrug resistance protein